MSPYESDVIPVWELRDPPQMGTAERAMLGRLHRATWYALPPDDYSDAPRRLASPICEYCGLPWGPFGCLTMLALAALSMAEHERDRANGQLWALREAVNALGVHGSWRTDPKRRVLTISLQVADIALRHGGVEVVDQTLLRLRKELAAEVGGRPPGDPTP